MNKIKVFSFSGGRTSARFIQYGEELRAKGHSVFYVFMDVGAEDHETYSFIKKVYSNWNIPLFCIRLVADTPLGKSNHFQVISVNDIKQDFFGWSQMLKKYGTPYNGGAFCTSRMKTEIFNKFCDSMFGKDNYDVYLGIRADEPNRFFNKEIVRLLKKAGIDDNQDMVEIFRSVSLNGGVNGKYDIWSGMGEPDLPSDELELLNKLIDKNQFTLDVNRIHYMAEFMDDTKQDVLEWWKAQPFDLHLDEWCGNCVFCIKKSITKVSAAIKDRPDAYIRFVNLLESQDVRVPNNRKDNYLVMYRGNNTLRHLGEAVKDVDRDTVVGRLRGVSVESGGCSESCEAFACEIEYERP